MQTSSATHAPRGPDGLSAARALLASLDAIEPSDVIAARPSDRELHVIEFDVTGAVPRSEPDAGPYRSDDIYVRLENRIYGPITRAELERLMTSGGLTGYESVSSDLATWTPLAYHPRIVLSQAIDPDATHSILNDHSDLPAVAARGPSALDMLLAFDDAASAAPQAAILARPKKKKKADAPRELPLPVFGDLDNDSLADVIERARIVDNERASWQNPTRGTIAMAAIVVPAPEAPPEDPVDLAPLLEPDDGLGDTDLAEGTTDDPTGNELPDALDDEDNLGTEPPSTFRKPLIAVVVVLLFAALTFAAVSFLR